MQRPTAHHDTETALMRELQHRFYNTLQVLGSTLRRVSASKSGKTVSLSDLVISDDHLVMLRSLHRKLSGSPKPEETLDEYRRDAVSLLVKAFGREEVAFSLNVADVQLAGFEELRLVLLAVGLVTNALKHGDIQPGGAIHVEIQRCGGTRLALCVSNANQGTCPAASRLPRIAAELATSLGGKLRIAVGAQYAAIVEFEPEPLPAALRLQPSKQEVSHGQRSR